MKTAEFSNGHTDTYKGKRDVRAAWMITNAETGVVLSSGHSLDRARAEKTATGNVRHVIDVGAYTFEVPRTLYMGHNYGSLFERARQNGYEGRPFDWRALKSWAKAHNEKVHALRMAAVRIEVIEI